MASTATHKTAMHHTTCDRGPIIWTSTDIREHTAASRAPTLGIVEAQPAKKMRSDTSEVSCTKHREMHGACPMTSEN